MLDTGWRIFELRNSIFRIFKLTFISQLSERLLRKSSSLRSRLWRENQLVLVPCPWYLVPFPLLLYFSQLFLCPRFISAGCCLPHFLYFIRAHQYLWQKFRWDHIGIL